MIVSSGKQYKISGRHTTPPMTPIPPALVTAAASLGPAATFIPASITGWLILRRSVTVVRICSTHELANVTTYNGVRKGLRGDAMIIVIEKTFESDVDPE